jgi:NitT/TauT family transport system substrate-binding protein
MITASTAAGSARRVTEPQGGSMVQRRKWLATASILMACALVAAGCGDDDDDDDGGAAAETTAAATTQTTAAATTTTAGESTETTAEEDEETTTTAAAAGVPGCEDAVTDPSDLSNEREVARCEEGAPEPQPLPEMTTVKFASAFRLEFMSPVLLADSLGEFEKENIKLEFINLPFSDSAPQLAQGAIDAAVGGFEIALFSAGNQGLPVKATLGNYYPPHAGDYDVPQTGLWCRRDSFADPQNPTDEELATLTWASSVGPGSSAIYYSAAEIQKRTPDFDITQTEIQRIPNTDILAALQNGAIDCGILLDPIWLQVAEDPAYWQAATQTPGEPLGMIAYGKNFLEDNREVGVAFARAIIRTINTYYSGDYHSDPEVLAEIARVTNQPDTANLTRVDSLVMDWEIREDTTTRIQDLFIKLGVITDWSEPVPEDAVVDRSFYLEAVGHAE